MKTYSINTKTATAHDFDCDWDSQPTLEAAMKMVNDIKTRSEDYREIEVTENEEDGSGKVIARFRRYDFKGDWSKVA